jgi:hypothetical protein
MQSSGVVFPRSDLTARWIFHGRFLRPKDFLLQSGAILRHALRKLNDRNT